ncbi:MAG: hypothetical protein K2X37_04245 [Chitinophagaceae bacterium]|nr:hypothetical protein [Chitinophagaceae bacterium]
MSGKKLDIIDKILNACYAHNSDALFVMSLMHQYEERGTLSKKQLEGLLHKARNVPEMPTNWIATLEATILKMHTKEKAPATINTPVFVQDEELGKKMEVILAKYPQHKRVVFLYARYKKSEPISATEKAEIEKFYKLLIGH